MSASEHEAAELAPPPAAKPAPAAALCMAAVWAASRVQSLRFDGDSAVSITPVE